MLLGLTERSNKVALLEPLRSSASSSYRRLCSIIGLSEEPHPCVSPFTAGGYAARRRHVVGLVNRIATFFASAELPEDEHHQPYLPRSLRIPRLVLKPGMADAVQPSRTRLFDQSIGMTSLSSPQCPEVTPMPTPATPPQG